MTAPTAADNRALADMPLFDTDTLKCPYHYDQTLREQAPVFQDPGSGVYVVSTYELVREAHKNDAVFSNDFTLALGSQRKLDTDIVAAMKDTYDLGKGTTPEDVLPRHIGHEQRSVALLEAVCKRLRVPTDCRDLAVVVAREHGNIHRSEAFGAAALTRLLERCDALRKPARFAEALQACEADARGRLGFGDREYPQTARLMMALEALYGI